MRRLLINGGGWGSAAAALLLLWTATSAGAQPGAWLNVRDAGASGSQFETTATTAEGSNRVTVADVGDFRVGQGVIVSRCNIRVTGNLWGPGEPYGSQKPLGDAVEIRGYDGSKGSWLVYLLEIDGANPVTFRWSDDVARTWKANKVAATFDWQALSNGIEVKFKQQEWQPGHMVSFSARDQLVSRIEQIEGNVLTLKDAANRAAADAVVRHNDQLALQAAVDQAIREKRNVYFPDGHYRLAGSLNVSKAAITIEGQSAENVVLDISDGSGPCFALYGGSEVTLRNFRMVGHTGLAEAAGSFRTSSGFGFWACTLKGCNAVTMSGTQRVLIENCHAVRMASEAFYAQGSYRTSTSEPEQAQKQLTYLRCSVTDCAANAFNNNDAGENTSVLYCRVDGAGWHAAEMPARFMRFIGNYVRNSGPVTIGDMSHRTEDLHNLGCGQAIIEDNVFEGIGRCGGIAVNHGSGQVVIRNNLFINYNGTAINASSYTVRTSYPSNTVTIADNIIDLTYAGENPAGRNGIQVTASNAIVADNQIYVRGGVDPRVTGIRVAEPALNVQVHDNLIRNCGTGLRTARIGSSVTEVIDPQTFVENGLPLEWRTSHLYRDWNVVWLAGDKPLGMSVIEAFDPETLRFRLKEPREMRVGDRFEVFPPSGPNWDLRGNTITGCAVPVVLDSYGGETAQFRGNLISRGGADAKSAIEVRGRFTLTGNQVSGFDGPDAAGLSLFPDKLGNPPSNAYRQNVIERCTQAVREAVPGLWEAAIRQGNEIIGCGADLAQASARPQVAANVQPAERPKLHAPALAKPVKVDGKLDEWPMADAARAVTLAVGPVGEPIAEPRAFACAAHDADSLYLAVRCTTPKGHKPTAGLDWRGDGVEVSFRCAEPGMSTPIFLLWGTTDGAFNSSPQKGASAEQTSLLESKTAYAAEVKEGEWTCEWRVPLKALGLDPGKVKSLLFNVGYRCLAGDVWLAWVPTGGAICEVDSGGELVIEG
jgi:hypothetical protein